MRRAFDWLFRHRATGNVVIGQFPNLTLATFMVCTLIRVVFHPDGVQGDALSLFGTVALVLWALDEIFRGVNPFRRISGGIVLCVIGAGVLL